MRKTLPLLAALLTGLGMGSAAAQDLTPAGFRLTPLREISPATPAKELFGRVRRPTDGRGRSIGFYSNGCLAGADSLPLTGPTWAVMRPSRQRFFGRAPLVRFVERLSEKVQAQTSWPGILVGDMSQPRGGPMLKGHASHQIGLDVDVWLRPMPRQAPSMAQRETMMSTVVVDRDRTDVDPDVWSLDHIKVLKAAATDTQVERVLVNAAIKKALCRDVRGDRAWLQKVRPIWGHDYHFHVRLACPAGEASCRPQADVTPGDGCGKALDWWFSDAVLRPRPPTRPAKPAPQLTMRSLPGACAAVLDER